MGLRINPTDVLAIAPATKLPGTDSLTNVVLCERVFDSEPIAVSDPGGGTGSLVIFWKKGR